MASSTSRRTLYRLRGVAPNIEAMLDALDPAQLDEIDADVAFPENLGVPALLISGSFEQPVASWCDDVYRTTGVEVARPVNRSAGLLMLADDIDDEVYAIGFDQGFRLVPDQLKDQRFGISFVIRRVDPYQIRDLVSHTPRGGRTDITLVPGGAPVWSLGIRDHAKIVRRLGGRLDRIQLTVSADSRTRVSSAQGGVGLQLRLGVEPGDLIADIREIARVVREEAPSPELEFVEHIVAVKDGELIRRLESELDDMLGRESDGQIGVAVPNDHWDDYDAAKAFSIRVNSPEGHIADDFSLAYVLDRARLQRPGCRFASLRDGTISLYRHERAQKADLIWSSRLLRWIEADVPLDSRRFFLTDGSWYEIGETYLKSIRSYVERLITATPSVDLPAWYYKHEELAYNHSVADRRPGYTCFDRGKVQTALHRGNGVEICDLLTPDNILVMVKRAKKGSDALSHLFSQGLVAVQTLLHSPDGAERFARKVAIARKGNGLPKGYRPKKVVFAILLKDGAPLTADTLFPFSQVTLVQTAKALESWGVEVEVVGIRSTQLPPARAGVRAQAA